MTIPQYQCTNCGNMRNYNFCATCRQLELLEKQVNAAEAANRPQQYDYSSNLPPPAPPKSRAWAMFIVGLIMLSITISNLFGGGPNAAIWFMALFPSLIVTLYGWGYT